MTSDMELRDWMYEVANGDTKLGFKEWQRHQRDAATPMVSGAEHIKHLETARWLAEYVQNNGFSVNDTVSADGLVAYMEKLTQMDGLFEELEPSPKMRRAMVHGARDRTQVEAYLPANYHVKTAGIGKNGRAYVQIEGIDNAGWTLDDYVIPRLASGLMACRETP